MKSDNIKRLSRLSAILLNLQSRRLVTASQLAEKFNVTIRTIYRVIRALEEAGVPVYTEEGKGYRLTDGYRIPPVMFTEDEAGALITAEFFMQFCKDESLIKAYSAAVQKLKAIMPVHLKTNTEMLEGRIGFNKAHTDSSVKSHFLLALQKALIAHRVVRITYTDRTGKQSAREVEPFAVYCSAEGDWLLIAHCRLRKEFRTFSLARIEEVFSTSEDFEPSAMTFAQYLKKFYGN